MFALQILVDPCRLPISVVLPRRRHRSVGTDGEGDGEEEENGDDEVEVEVEAEAYYAHRSYAAEMWRRSGEKGLRVYSEEDALGYVRPKDRLRDTTFFDQIHIFLASGED